MVANKNVGHCFMPIVLVTQSVADHRCGTYVYQTAAAPHLHLPHMYREIMG